MATIVRIGRQFSTPPNPVPLSAHGSSPPRGAVACCVAYWVLKVALTPAPTLVSRVRMEDGEHVPECRAVT